MKTSAKARAATILTAAALCGSATVRTQQTLSPPATAAEILRQSYADMLRARAGHVEVVPQSVARLERAAAAEPANGALWNALARAYFLQSAAVTQGTGTPSSDAIARALEAVQRAADASARALQLDPDDPIALANHGTALLGLSAARKDRDGMAQGRTEMNRAIELAPSLIPPRVKRGISSLGLPPAFRDAETVIADARVLIGASEGTRAGDMLHLLLGDVYADAGRAADARREYEAAARPTSAAAELARTRLASLDQGGVPAAETARLRARVGTCTTCHAD